MAVEVRDNREGPEVRIPVVLGLVGGFILVVVAVMFGLHLFYRGVLVADLPRQVLGNFPVPQIQPSPTNDLREFRRRQNEQLTGYAWVDQAKGLVHVPIERAMQLVIARGPAALDAPDQPSSPAGKAPPGPPDGAPRAPASMQASPYGPHQ